MRERWERLTGESAKAYANFVLYRDMGPDRSLRKMKASVNGSPSIRRLQVLSARWKWVDRATAYDDHMERERRVQQEKARREMNDRQAKIGLMGQNLAVKAIERLLADVQAGEKNLGAAELARLLDVTAKLERLARGESTDIHQAVGPGGGPVQIEHAYIRAVRSALGFNDPPEEA